MRNLVHSCARKGKPSHSGLGRTSKLLERDGAITPLETVQNRFTWIKTHMIDVEDFQGTLQTVPLGFVHRTVIESHGQRPKAQNFAQEIELKDTRARAAQMKKAIIVIS